MIQYIDLAKTICRVVNFIPLVYTCMSSLSIHNPLFSFFAFLSFALFCFSQLHRPSSTMTEPDVSNLNLEEVRKDLSVLVAT